MVEGVEYHGSGFARYWLDPIGDLQHRFWLWRSRRALSRVFNLRQQGKIRYDRDLRAHMTENDAQSDHVVITPNERTVQLNRLLKISGVSDEEIAAIPADDNTARWKLFQMAQEKIKADLEAGRKEYLQGRSIDDVFTPMSDYRRLSPV